MKVQPSSIERFSDQTNLSAWRALLAQAAPDASQTLIAQQPQVLPRFADYYRRLQSLPRRLRRHLQRQCRGARQQSGHGARRAVQSLAGVALLLALGQAPALAATINVGGGCSLVDAITAANTDSALGLCTAGSGADILALRPNSTHTLTTVNNSTAYGPTGLPVIASPVTIAGNGSTITRPSSAPAFRILAVGSTGNLTLRATTISGGQASGPGFAEQGGGAFVKSGGALTLDGSTVSRNTAADGGGAFVQQSALTLTNSTVSGNSASLRGGGVRTISATAILTESTISGNSAISGGGAFVQQSALTLTNSTVSGNSATSGGGGATNVYGRLTLTNSTVSGNRAGRGGGVFNGGSVPNFKSEVALNHSLISGNTATLGGAEVYQQSGGVVTAGNLNIFGHSGLTTAQALVGVTPGGFDTIATSDGTRPTALASILNPILANNGGLTQTHALPAASPALDITFACPPSPATDQRGVPRPQDGNNDGNAQCDIGAFERVRPGTVTCDGLPATKVGTSAAETINGTAGVDVIQGLAGNDIIKGLAGNDVVCGGVGNDRLFGGAGEDRLFGEAGTDQLNGELDFDRCDGGAPATGDTAASCEQVSNVP